MFVYFSFRGLFEIDFRNPRYSVSEDGKELTIMLSEIDDTGTYRCIAENVAGETEKDFELDVQGKGDHIGIKSSWNSVST